LPKGDKVVSKVQTNNLSVQVKVDFLSDYIKEKGLSESEFANLIGVAHSTVNRVLNRKRNAGGKFITGVLSNFPELSFEQVFICITELPKGNKTA
jgi:transposase